LHFAVIEVYRDTVFGTRIAGHLFLAGATTGIENRIVLDDPATAIPLSWKSAVHGLLFVDPICLDIDQVASSAPSINIRLSAVFAGCPGAPPRSPLKIGEKIGPFPRYAQRPRSAGECRGQGECPNGYLLKGPMRKSFSLRALVSAPRVPISCMKLPRIVLDDTSERCRIILTRPRHMQSIEAHRSC
jgi:hypothetical protein